MGLERILAGVLVLSLTGCPKPQPPSAPPVPKQKEYRDPAIDKLADDVVARYLAGAGGEALEEVIAFTQEKRGSGEICVISPTTREMHNLTQHPSDDKNPAWSADGRRLAFVSDRDKRKGNDIYTMNRDGSDIKRITTTENMIHGNLHWSPDGTKIIYEARKSDSKDIYIVGSSGGEPKLVQKDAFYPKWSPDGKRAAYVGKSTDGIGLYVMDTKNFTTERLAASGLGLILETSTISEMEWSPDGTLIAYCSVFVESVSTSGVRRISGRLSTANTATNEIRHIKEGAYWFRMPSFSKDGQHLVFCFDLAGQVEHKPGHYTIKIDGSDMRLVLKAMMSSDCSWSSNGKYLAFYGFGEKGRVLYTADVETREIRKLAELERVVDLRPVWSPR